MIEVLFGESEAGTMREIKRRGQSGGRAEVICLGFMLDIGDIRESADSQYRKDLIILCICRISGEAMRN